MKQWEDWIIFLGFPGDQYDNTMSVVKMWNKRLAETGLNQDNLKQLRDWLFTSSYTRIWHSCCLSFNSIHMEGNYIAADWVGGGGLPEIYKKYIKVENNEFSERYDDYCAHCLPVYFFTDCTLQVIGMTMNGKIVMDTFQKYGCGEDIRRRMQELGEYKGYCEEFLETVKENYQKTLLPEVPKGLLKIPLSI